jgi:hypothetical protein
LGVTPWAYRVRRGERHDHTGREQFTPAVKACRDRLVGDVERLLGVPIIGTMTSVERISTADLVAARQCLDWAIAALAEEPEPVGPHVLACRSELHAVAGLLDAVAATPSERQRRLRLPGADCRPQSTSSQRSSSLIPTRPTSPASDRRRAANRSHALSAAS